MAVQTRRRSMTPDERDYVEEDIHEQPDGGARHFLRNWKYSLIGLALVWLAIAHAVEEVSDATVLFDAQILPVAAVAILALSVFAAFVMTRIGRSSYDPEIAEDARQALASGEVVDKIFQLREGKVFVQPGKSGLVYFLRTDEDRVYVWFDEESEDLADEGKSIFSGKTKPLTRLIIPTSVAGDYEFDVTFEGSPIPLSEPMPLIRNEDKWPDDEEFCKVDWADVESRFRK